MTEAEVRPTPASDARKYSAITKGIKQIAQIALSASEMSPQSDEMKSVDNSFRSVMQSKWNKLADAEVSTYAMTQGGLAGVGELKSVLDHEDLR